MKRNLKLPMVVALTVALTTPAMAQTSFSDVAANQWYTNAVHSAVSNGLLSGYQDGTMRPSASITRAEIASVLSKAFGAEVKANMKSFTDVTSSQWFYDAMARAVNMGLFAGNGNGTLTPSAPITREEAAVVIAKAFELTGSNKSVLNRFNDASEVSNWAVPFISGLVENGYMAGNDKGELNPKGNITRAEFAQIMYNITNDYITAAGVVEESFDGNVVIREGNVTLKNLKIDGDLIIADGVAKDSIKLDNVIVTGNIIIRGGNIDLTRVDVRGKVIVRNVNGTSTLTGKETTINELDAYSSVIINKGVTVKTINANAKGITISGTGDVDTVYANENNVTVTAPGTKVVAANGVTGTKAGNKTVEATKSEVVPEETTGGSGGGSSSSSKKTKYVTYTIEEDGDLYKVTADADNDELSDFNNKKYVVKIEGVVELKKTVLNGADAIELARDIVLDENIDMEKLLKTVDSKEINKNSKYAEYREEINSLFEKLLDEEDYAKLAEAREEAIEAAGGDESEVKLYDVYSNYEAKGGDVKATIANLLDEVSNKSIYSEVLIYFLVEESDFIDTLID